MSLRYKIPFASFEGNSYRIDIYDSTYSGAAVELSVNNPTSPAVPSDLPIYIEEDNNDDLLECIRIKTGYIELVEQTYGALTSLYPRTNTQNSVLLYRGTELVFSGYMQAQAFENDYVSAPRTIRFPIFSTLAGIREQKFQTLENEGDLMIGYFLDEMLVDYFNDIILPASALFGEEVLDTPLQLRVNERIVCPWNTDYDFGLTFQGETPSTQSPWTIGEFLEQFCHLFGLICHEYGKTIIFTKVEAPVQYVRMYVPYLTESTTSSTGLPTGATPLVFEDYFTPAGDNDTEGNVMPLGKLTMNFGEQRDAIEMDLSRSKYSGTVIISGETYSVLEAKTSELTSPYLTHLTNASGEYVRIVGDGSRECLQVVISSSSSTAFAFGYLFEPCPRGLTTLEIESTFGAGSELLYTVYSGGQYLDESGEWGDTPYYFTLTFDGDGKAHGPATYNATDMVNASGIYLAFYKGTTATHGIITSMKITRMTNYSRYNMPDRSTATYVGTLRSSVEGEVDMPLNNQNVLGDTVVQATYPYLLKSQLRHKRTVRMTTAMDIYKLYLFNIVTAGYSDWRAIAISMNPIDDTYTITLHQLQLT